MTEREFQDPPAFAPELEIPRDNFSIQNLYTPDSLFTILMQDYKARSIFLQNNSKKVFEDDYDPVWKVFMSVHSSIKARSKGHVGLDRDKKIFWFRSEIHIGSKLREACQYYPSIFQSKLAESGINVDLVHAKEGVTLFPSFNDSICYYTPKPKPKFLKEDYFVSKSTEEFKNFALHVGHYHCGEDMGTVELFTPWWNMDLDTSENFAKMQINHVSLTEKVIRAIYKLRNRQLPPAVLQFEPEKETSKTSKEFFATCSYCQSNYFTGKSLDCPHCGASHPRFMIKEKEDE